MTNFSKAFLYIAVIFILPYCNNTATQNVDNSKYYTTKDTVTINGIKYSKAAFNKIIDNHPELVSDNVLQPAETYNKAYDSMAETSNSDRFFQPHGEEDYYQLYTYFLKQKNGIAQYADRRSNTINLFSNINDLFHSLSLIQGTSYIYQLAIIPACAEYAVYLYKKDSSSALLSGSFAQQKAAYIQSLRQLIVNTEKDNWSLPYGDADPYEILNKIEKNITDNFYLQQAKQFKADSYSDDDDDDSSSN